MTMREADSTPAPGERLMELGVLVTARELNSQYEWTAHEPTALRAGLDQATIDVVKFRKDVDSLGEKESAVVQLGREMFENNKVSSNTFARALKHLGEEGLVNLVVHIEEYAGTALLLRTFDQQLRPGWKPLLPIP
jgi:4-carboxymuconolactone decarboxylase